MYSFAFLALTSFLAAILLTPLVRNLFSLLAGVAPNHFKGVVKGAKDAEDNEGELSVSAVIR